MRNQKALMSLKLAVRVTWMNLRAWHCAEGHNIVGAARMVPDSVDSRVYAKLSAYSALKIPRVTLFIIQSCTITVP
jgi:hypothetical protein